MTDSQPARGCDPVTNSRAGDPFATDDCPVLPQHAHIVAKIAENVAYWGGADFVAPSQRDLMEARSHLSIALLMLAEEPVAGGGVEVAMRKVVDAARKMLADCEHTSLGASKCYSYTPDKIELTGLAEALKELDGAL